MYPIYFNVISYKPVHGNQFTYYIKMYEHIFVATFEHLLSRTSLHVNIKMCPYAFVLKLIQASEA